MQAVTPEECKDYAWNVDFTIDPTERDPKVWEEWVGALEVSQGKWINRHIVGCDSDGNWRLDPEHRWVSKILACVDYLKKCPDEKLTTRITKLYQATMATMREIIEQKEKKKNRCC